VLVPRTRGGECVEVGEVRLVVGDGGQEGRQVVLENKEEQFGALRWIGTENGRIDHEIGQVEDEVFECVEGQMGNDKGSGGGGPRRCRAHWGHLAIVERGHESCCNLSSGWFWQERDWEGEGGRGVGGEAIDEIEKGARGGEERGEGREILRGFRSPSQGSQAPRRTTICAENVFNDSSNQGRQVSLGSFK